MGILDKAVAATKKVTGAAQEGLAEAKDKGQSLVLKRKINGYAEGIGHLVARQKGGEAGLDAEVDRLVSEIRAVEAEIKALDEA
jgi:molybdenum-dependent DNA-binding transcriptional regulator ModE